MTTTTCGGCLRWRWNASVRKTQPSSLFFLSSMNSFFDDALVPSLSWQILAFADSRRGMCSVTRRDTAGDGCGTQTPAGGAVRLTTRAALSHADWYPSVNTRETDIIDTCCPRCDWRREQLPACCSRCECQRAKGRERCHPQEPSDLITHAQGRQT
jgi:hypothetical protein